LASSLGQYAPPAPPVSIGCGLPPVSPRDVDQNINIAQTQFWGLTLERKLGSKAVVALEYNGAHGLHLYDINNINEIGGGQAYLGEAPVTSDPNNPACTAASPCLTRPNQAFTSINNRGSNGFSHYNALNVHFQTQEFGRTGLFVLANYTWAHAQDNLSSTFSESNSQFNLGFLDPRNPRLDYGNADFDITNQVVFSMIWTEPYLKTSQHQFLKQVGSGWSLEPTFTARSGAPFSIWDTTNSLNSVEGAGIPRYVPSAAITNYRTGAGASAGSPNLFNLLSVPADVPFANPAFATAGFPGGIADFGPFPSNMTARNAFFGPGAWNFDVAVGKTFPISERVERREFSRRPHRDPR
jgi:hypothetical protein